MLLLFCFLVCILVTQVTLCRYVICQQNSLFKFKISTAVWSPHGAEKVPFPYEHCVTFGYKTSGGGGGWMASPKEEEELEFPRVGKGKEGTHIIVICHPQLSRPYLRSQHSWIKWILFWTGVKCVHKCRMFCVSRDAEWTCDSGAADKSTRRGWTLEISICHWKDTRQHGVKKLGVEQAKLSSYQKSRSMIT